MSYLIVMKHYSLILHNFFFLCRCVTREEQETASSLMAAGLGIGLAVGGALSSVIVRIL